MATVTVDLNTSYQTFNGWQVSLEVGASDFPVSGQNYKQAAVDAAVDFGVNRGRVGLSSGSLENTTDYWQLFLNANSDFPHATRDTWAANRRVPVNDNGDPNTINASGFQWAHLSWQLSQVVDLMRSALAARGETLYLIATYVHFSTSNQLHIDNPAEYGEYVLAVWNWFTANKGYVPDALEILLEPDNGSVGATGSEVAAMIIAARDRLVNAGYTKPDFIAPSTVSGPNADDFYNAIKTANAQAAAYIETIGYHRYVNLDNIALGQLRTLADTEGKELSMSEFGGATYLHLWDDLKVGKNVAWEQYAISYPSASGPAPGFQLWTVGGSPTYALTMEERAKYLHHFYKFIRRGAVMKAVSVGGTGSGNVDALAFLNANGSDVVVMKFTAAADVDLAGLVNGNKKVVYTTGDGTNAPSAYWQSLPDENVTNGTTGTLSMPGAGVMTVYDEGFLTQLITTGGGRAGRFL